MDEVIFMMVNTDAMVSISEANQNFSRVARMADEKGSVVIMKNNAPRYLLIEFSQAEAMQTASDEEVLSVSARLLAKNQVAYRELAKLSFCPSVRSSFCTNSLSARPAASAGCGTKACRNPRLPRPFRNSSPFHPTRRSSRKRRGLDLDW